MKKKVAIEDLPSGWMSVVFCETISKISAQDKKIKQRDYLESGYLPVIDQGQEFIGGYTNNRSKEIECDFPVVVFGDHTKVVKLIHFPFAPGADGVKIIKPSKIYDPKHLPDPDVLAGEIVENLEAGLENFREIVAKLA